MRIALFVDANSISYQYIDVIYKEAIAQGEVIIRNVYGAFGKNSRYRNALADNSFYIVETPSLYKERVSMRLVADMMKVVDEKIVDTIMLATLDEYITPMLSMIREKGMRVLVLGSCRKCDVLKRESNKFIYLEALCGQNVKECVTPIADIVKTIRDIASSYKGRGERLTAEAAYGSLCRKYSDFDIRNYGYTHFEAFIKNEVSGIHPEYDNNQLYINLADDNKEVESFIYNYIAAKGNKLDDMQELFDALTEKFRGFSTAHYGYNSEYAFILSFPKLEIYGNKGIKLKQTFKLK